MKIDRLLAIVILLLNRDRVQARELAALFEVSLRTIYRDIEAINQAGIPIVAFPGNHGGLEIMDGYKLERNVLNEEEFVAVLRALSGMGSVMGSEMTLPVAEKIAGLLPPDQAAALQKKCRQVVIDLSGAANAAQKATLVLLREAIEACRLVLLSYCSSAGEKTEREVEPTHLLFQDGSWYVQGYCRLRKGFRLFRLSRIKLVKALSESFAPREEAVPPLLTTPEGVEGKRTVRLSLKFSAVVEFRVMDWFPAARRQGEHVYVDISYPEDEWVYGFLLSFGPFVEVLAPAHIRQIVAERAAQVVSLYREG